MTDQPVARIRPAAAGDRPALLRVAEASGLFEADELEVLTGMLDEHFAGNSQGRWWVDAAEDGVRGIAYAMPEAMTRGTWNLLLLAVHPDQQGSGRGSDLMRHLESELRERGGRLLLVETLATPDFDGVRGFYRRRGFEEEARIRDFYEPGGDKIVFRKVF